MKPYLILLVLSVFALSCSETKVSDKPADVKKSKVINSAPKPGTEIQTPVEVDSIDEEFRVENYLVPRIPSGDFMEVKVKAGIFISPDGLQIAKMQKELGEDGYNTVVDDNIYYEFESKEFLKSKGIKIITS